MKTSKILVVVIVLQGLTLLGLWSGHGVLPVAQAQVIDSGGQRQQIIEELKAVNGKLDRLVGLLEGGQLQVKAGSPDEANGKAAK